MINVRNLRKTFGPKVAVNGISFEEGIVTLAAGNATSILTLTAPTITVGAAVRGGACRSGFR